MKIIKYAVAVILAAFVSVQCIRAETTAIQVPAVTMPESLQIGSIEVLRGYALEQSTQVYASLWSQSSVPASTYSNYIWEQYVRDDSGTDPKKILAILSSRPLVLEVANAVDWCWAYAGIQNNDGDTLFSAYNSFKLTNDGGGYFIPNDALKVSLQMNSQIPIYLPGVTSVRVLERDQNGNIIRDTYLEGGADGKFYWPSYFSSDQCLGGEVILSTWNGSNPVSTVYNLKTGLPTGTTKTAAALDVGIDGVVAVRNGNLLYGNIYVLVTNGVPPTIVATFDYDADSQIVIAVPEPGFDWGHGFTPKETPIQLSIRAEGQAVPALLDYDPASWGYPILHFKKGTYYIVPIWKNLKGPQQYYPPYNGGGGKG